MTILVKDTAEGASFQIRVAPRASRNRVAAVIGEGAEAALKIALNAPPVEGRANEAVIEFLSQLLGVPRSATEIAAGEHARNKRIVVRGRTAASVAALLQSALEASEKKELRQPKRV